MVRFPALCTAKETEQRKLVTVNSVSGEMPSTL